MIGARRLLATQASGAIDFFGYYSMLREFWPEDPSWTNPGDGNSLTTVRDNGSIAADLTAGTIGGGTGPTYQATGAINSKPCFEFHASSVTVGGYLATSSGTNLATNTTATIVCVGKFDTSGAFEYMIDCFASYRIIIGKLSTNKWRGYHSAALNVDAGTSDTTSHLFVFRIENDNTQLWVDNASQGTDTSGATSDSTGIVLGANASRIIQALNGSIAYAAVYSGDLTADGDFADWQQALADYYGVTLA